MADGHPRPLIGVNSARRMLQAGLRPTYVTKALAAEFGLSPGDAEASVAAAMSADAPVAAS